VRHAAGAGVTARARRPPGHAPAGRGPRAVAGAVITVSDTRRGADDRGGHTAAARLEAAGHVVVARAWVRDEPAAIRRVLRGVLARADVDVVVLTGGTGLAPRDRTIEAVAPLIERPLPGFGELFRALSFGQVGAAAWMSRAQAGVARGRLLFALPGSVRAVDLAMRRLIVPELVHALRTLGRFSTRE
jgi:molybdenum cofactor biosynthesis protein B